MRTVILALFLCVTAATLSAWAQTPDPNQQAANAAYQAKDWTKAASLYANMAQAEPKNFRYWYRLGVAEQSLGEKQKDLDAFEEAGSNGMLMIMLGYSLASAYASVGQTDKAFDALKEAVAQGYGQPDQMTSDPVLQLLRADARFSPLVEQAKRNQAPCNYTAENRQFDFWVGAWDVVATQGGTSQGHSRIERELGNCVIWENWTSLGSGYVGKSYNVYNASLKRWEQFWVDNVGGMIHFYGGLKDWVMDFWTDEMPQPDGSKLKRHLQFFNLGPDTVRQFSQGSKDGGKTWTVEYDFTYNRVKGA